MCVANIGSIMLNNGDYIRAEQYFSEAIQNSLNSKKSFQHQLLTMRDQDEGDELNNNMLILACRYYQKGMAMF